MLEQKDIEIGGERMVIQALPAMEGLSVGIKLAKILAGMSEGVGDLFVDDIADLPLNPGKIVAGLIGKLDERETPQFIRKLIRDSMVKPAWDDDQFQLRFASKWDELIDLLTAIIALNKYDDLVKKRIQEPLKALFSKIQPLDNSTP